MQCTHPEPNALRVPATFLMQATVSASIQVPPAQFKNVLTKTNSLNQAKFWSARQIYIWVICDFHFALSRTDSVGTTCRSRHKVRHFLLLLYFLTIPTHFCPDFPCDKARRPWGASDPPLVVIHKQDIMLIRPQIRSSNYKHNPR